MISLRREVESIFLIFILSAAFLLAWNKFYKPTFHFSASNLPSAPSPTPSPEPLSPVQTITTQSPDGKKDLIMEKQLKGDLVNYSFSVLDKEENILTFLYSKNLAKSEAIDIPFNTWSPDNKYIFIKEEGVYYLWLLSAETTTPIKISELFTEKYKELSLDEITGWAAPGLLIVNAKTTDGVQSSLWFDVVNQNFIPLATTF